MTTYLSRPHVPLLVKEEQNISHQNCEHNVLDSVARRHYRPNLPKVTGAGMAGLKSALAWLKRLCREQGLGPGTVERWSPEQVIATRAPCKREVYRKAFANIEKYGWKRHWPNVQAWVKDEKGPDNGKPCRLIQHRSAEYCAMLSTWLAPLEHKLYNVSFNGTRLFAKGLDPKQRASQIFGAERIGHKYVMLDHSAFDAHMSARLLRLEHAFYLWVFKGDKQLQKLLSYQLRNKVYTAFGLYWVSSGGRMSGDFNTALGNSLINTLILRAYIEASGLGAHRGCQQQADGDDSWIVVPSCHPDPTPEQFLPFGMSTKVEGVTTIPEQVGFCQGRPVMLEDGPMMCRDPVRVLSRLIHTIQRFDGKAWDSYARGVAECEMALSKGVPILESIADSLSKSFGSGKTITPRSEEWAHNIAMKVASPGRRITDGARASFALAWGYGPGLQQELEVMISKHNWRIPAKVERNAA